ncbi:phosphotransferase [Lachnospiraceae bacterium 47-T17]
MYYRAEQILSAYPREFTGNTKGRGSILCTDSEGIYLLKEYNGSLRRLEVLEGVLGHLKQHGFLAEELVRTRDGELRYQDVDGTSYFLRKTFQGRECDTRNQDEILYVIRHMAKLHVLLSDYGKQPSDAGGGSAPGVVLPDGAWDGAADEGKTALSLAGKHTRELKKVKNYVRNKKKKNDFESEFLRGYDHYMEQAVRVLELEEKYPLPEYAAQLCHGDFNQHNLLFTREGLALVGFEKLRYDLCVCDLTNFMRKILEKHNWNGGLGMDMVMAYNTVRTLEDWELRRLYIKLLYPEKFWKLVNHYYNARKTWVSGQSIEKLVRLFSQEQKREEFLSMLFYLIK